MGAFGTAFCPLEDLHDSTVLCLACGHRVIGGETFGLKQGDVLASELQKVGFFAGLRFVGDDDDGATTLILHDGSSGIVDGCHFKRLDQRIASRVICTIWAGARGWQDRC